MQQSYIDLIIKIKNGAMAKKQFINVGYTKLNKKILDILKKENYILDYGEKDIKKNIKEYIVEMQYNGERNIISGIKLISKPGRKIYSQYSDLKSVVNGTGISILSTNKGVMSNRNARKLKVGGQILFEIW